MPLSKRVNMAVSAGLAVGLLDSTASWTRTVSVTGGSTTRKTTRGDDFFVAWGAYAGANLSYQFDEHWSAVGGAQFQYLGKYRHSFKGQKVEMDLSQAIFVALGVSYSF